MFFLGIFRRVVFPAAAALAFVGSPAMGSIVPHGGGFLMSLDDRDHCTVLAHHELTADLSARIELLQLIAAGGVTYAEYARHLEVLKSQLTAGVSYWDL